LANFKLLILLALYPAFSHPSVCCLQH